VAIPSIHHQALAVIDWQQDCGDRAVHDAAPLMPRHPNRGMDAAADGASPGTPHHCTYSGIDRIFGHDFVEQVKTTGIKQVLSEPR